METNKNDTDPRQNPLPDDILKHVRIAAANLAAAYGVPECDVDDFVQRICLRVADAAAAFDPGRNVKYATFARRAVDFAVRDIERELARRRRLAPETVSLDAPLSPDSAECAGDAIPAPADELEARMLEIDIRIVLDLLPARERRAAELLLEGRNTREIPVLLGIARSTFMADVLPAVRRAFRTELGIQTKNGRDDE